MIERICDVVGCSHGWSLHQGQHNSCTSAGCECKGFIEHEGHPGFDNTGREFGWFEKRYRSDQDKIAHAILTLSVVLDTVQKAAKGEPQDWIDTGRSIISTLRFLKDDK